MPLISEWSASPESCWSGKWKKENERPDRELKWAPSACTRQVLYTGTGWHLCRKTLSLKTIPLFHPDRYTKSPLSRQMMERVITPCLLFNRTFYHCEVLLSGAEVGFTSFLLWQSNDGNAEKQSDMIDKKWQTDLRSVKGGWIIYSVLHTVRTCKRSIYRIEGGGDLLFSDGRSVMRPLRNCTAPH